MVSSLLSYLVMKVAVVYSLPTKRARESAFLAADEDTASSAIEVEAALKAKGIDSFFVPVAEDNIPVLKSIKADCIFNLIEWDGRDIGLQLTALEIMEDTGIPIVGTTLKTMTLLSSKIKMKETLEMNGLLTPGWQLFETGNEAPLPDLNAPLIVKLALEHCSVGLNDDAVVTDKLKLPIVVRDRIRQFGQPVFAEEFIIGRELQVTLLEKERGMMVLPPAEIVFTATGTRAFLSFDSRWDETHPDYAKSKVILAKLTKAQLSGINEMAKRSWEVFGFRDYARLDVRLKGDKIYLLEANANPGLGDHPDYGMTVSYRAVGMTFSDFIWEIVQSCLQRYGRT